MIIPGIFQPIAGKISYITLSGKIPGYEKPVVIAIPLNRVSTQVSINHKNRDGLFLFLSFS